MMVFNQVVPYLVLLLNTILFTILRKVLFAVIPVIGKNLVAEFLATLELCAGCAELGVVWELHGNVGYGVALLLCCLWWSRVWDGAEACPCGPLEDCLLVGTPFASWDITSKLLGQVLGAIATANYINCIWCWHLVPEHLALHTSKCQAALQVTMFYGALIEGMITFVSRIVALESGHWSQRVSDWANSLTTVFLCIYGLDTTGGFFNPILASALTLNCEGNNIIQHIFVYWMGALTGGIIARTLHMWIRGVPKAEKLE